MYWVIYNNDQHPDPRIRGEIELVYEGDEAMAQQCVRSNQTLIEAVADPQNDYVDVATETVMAKQALALALDKDTIVADGIDQAVLSGLPVPFDVEVNGAIVTVSDGTLEISTTDAGVHRICVGSAAYHQQRFKVYAT